MSKGISKQLIVDEAGKLVQESGISAFSMHALADRLHIRTASLYSHVSGMDEVMTLLGGRILAEYRDAQMKAIEGKTRREAVLALAAACRTYAAGNGAYYEVIMQMQTAQNEKLAAMASVIIDPIMTVLDGYTLSGAQRTDCERAFRAMVHGFISQERHGYFSHIRQSTDESFVFAVNMIADGIEAVEREN